MKSRQISDMRGPGSGRRHRETLISVSLPLESAMFDCIDCNFQTCVREESALQTPQASASKLRTSQVRHTTFARKKPTNKYCVLDSLSACDVFYGTSLKTSQRFDGEICGLTQEDAKSKQRQEMSSQVASF